MRPLIALTLIPAILPGCGVMITEEEYLERITPRLSGEVTAPEGLYYPPGEVQVGLLAVDLNRPLLYGDDPELLASTSLGEVVAGEAYAYSMDLPVDFAGVEFGELDPDEPGMLGQAWGLGAWSWAPDRPEDGVGFSPQDNYLAASTVKLLAWIVEPQGRYASELQAQAGFNFLTYDYDSQRVLGVTPVITTGMSWVFSLDTAMQSQQDLRATVSLTGSPARHPRVDLYRTDELGLTAESSYPAPTLASHALASTSGTEFVDFVHSFEEPRWDHLTSRPPAVDVGDLGIMAAVYAGIAYEDANEDGEWAGLDGTELPLGSSLSLQSGDDSYIVLCLRPVAFRAAFAEEEGLSMGWQVVRVRDSGPETADWSTGIAVD